MALSPDTRSPITPERAADLQRRFKAIEGQVRGLSRMVEEGRACLDVLTQMAAVQEALRAAGKVVVRNYLETCATEAIRSDDPGEQAATYDALMDVVYKYIR
jgi:DNA-binding FrmR family transcriptional regulator